MRQYIVKRCLLAIPVLLLVMMLAFMLSRLVPGDGAMAMLSLQGVETGSPVAPQEYRKHYLALGLDKPYFYFSVRPDFYPRNLNEVTDPTRREEISELLKQKIPFGAIQSYLQARDRFQEEILKAEEPGADTYEAVQRALLFNRRLPEIQSFVQSVPPALKMTGSYGPLKDGVDGMANSKKTWYYPVIHWHGIENQFHAWFTNMISGNPGVSYRDGRPVSDKIAVALNWTITLLVLNILVSLLISLPSGFIAGFYAGGRFDSITHIVWLALYTMPVFWLASLLILYFTSPEYATWMNIFPLPGLWLLPEGSSFLTTIHHLGKYLILPVLCLAANDIAYLSRLIRDNVVVQKSKLYVLMARARGLSEGYIARRHILPNIMIPLVTVIGGRISAGFAGTLVIEIIFGIPGMGRLIHQSITTADWNVVFGILVVIGLITLLSMLVTDILYAWLNPRIRFEA